MIAARNRRWRAANPNQIHAMNLRRYGITQQHYILMFSAQGGVCACCGRPETRVRNGRTVALAVDHDHECCPGKTACGRCIRGLLCGSCNQAIGLLSDSVGRVLAMADYLSRPTLVFDS